MSKRLVSGTDAVLLESDGSLVIGGPADYAQHAADGALSLAGTARAWKDINLGAAMLSLPVATQPDEVEIVDENGDGTGIYTWGFAVNELVSGVFEMQHDYAEGTDITFHVHWGGNAAPTGTDYVKWQMDYTIVRGSNTINAVTSLTVETAYDTQYEWIRSDFSAIDGSTGGVAGGNILIGDQFFFMLKRIAAAGDAYAGDALVATLGLHYQVDTMGSRQIGTK